MEPNQQPSPSSTDKPYSESEPVVMPPAQPRRTSPVRLTSALVIAAVLILGVAVMVSRKQTASPTTTIGTASGSILPAAQISITPTGFSPATIKIKKGQTVMWVNNDTKPHQPASDPYPTENTLAGFLDDTALTHGETYGFTFDQAGTFTYHDHLNPFQLKGTVIAQ